jgi:predicted esterase
VKKVLESVKDKAVPQPGKCIAAGFSQGGQLAAELAAAHPEFFAGAFVMSPGYMGSLRLNDAIKAGGGNHSPQTYFVIYQRGESFFTVGTAKSGARLLSDAGARVITHAFKGNQHSFPPFVEDHFTIWGKVILDGKSKPLPP